MRAPLIGPSLIARPKTIRPNTARSAALLLGLLSPLLAGCDPVEPAGASPVAFVGPAAIARCRIDVEGGVIRLAAQREGLIREVTVEEGDRVRTGQSLARIDSRQAELRAAVTEAEWEQARSAVATERVRLAAAEREARRRHEGGAAAFSQRLREEADTEMEARRTQLATAIATATAAGKRAAEAAFEIEARVIRAPVDGTIVKRRARPGDGVTVQTVTELFQLVPDGPRIARCDLEEPFLGRVSVGRPATIVLESDESVRLPATVKRVGSVFGVPAPSGDPTARQDIRTVETVLTLHDAGSLLIGQRVRAYVTAPGEDPTNAGS